MRQTNGHFGIDIATPTNTSFTSIADGVVAYSEWTINYGYVIHLQHSNGITSVYKHGSSLTETTGRLCSERRCARNRGRYRSIEQRIAPASRNLEEWNTPEPRNVFKKLRIMFKKEENTTVTASKNQTPSLTMISEGTSINGTIDTENDIRIAGKTDGELNDKREAYCNINRCCGRQHHRKVMDADIAGKIDGELRVTNKLNTATVGSC